MTTLDTMVEAKGMLDVSRLALVKALREVDPATLPLEIRGLLAAEFVANMSFANAVEAHRFAEQAEAARAAAQISDSTRSTTLEAA